MKIADNSAYVQIETLNFQEIAMLNAKYYCTRQISFANNFGLYINSQQSNQYERLQYGRIDKR